MAGKAHKSTRLSNRAAPLPFDRLGGAGHQGAMKTALVTGSAGFIGYFTARRLLDQGWRVIGLDAFSDYYEVALKERRQAMLSQSPGFVPLRARLEDPGRLMDLFAEYQPDLVVHLAAQAGVRFSIDSPRSYVEANLIGTFELLEAARAHPPAHMLLASTSSAYGANTDMPFSEHQPTVHPLQFYAATKRANELMAHAYSHLYRLPTTGLRFFTVYGPWGRPDMALFLFTRNILEGKPIQVFNHGNHTRDFTYVTDIAEGVIRVSDQIAQPNPHWNSDQPDPATSNAPWRLFNIGNNNPVKLSAYIEAIEAAVGKKAIQELLPLQAGDVPDTYANVNELQTAVGYKPATPVKEGVANFVAWYRQFYGV